MKPQEHRPKANTIKEAFKKITEATSKIQLKHTKKDINK